MFTTPKKICAFLLLGFTAVSLSGCIHMYRPDVQQGNIITEDKLSQLKPGMTQEQVSYIMGTPVLVNTFDPNHWEYVYTFKHAQQPRQQEHITLTFDKGVLKNIQKMPLVPIPETF